MKKALILLLFLFLMGCSNENPLTLRPLKKQDVILAFGDSLTYGVGATPETSFPAVLQKLIGVKVINAGLPGEETSGGVARIDKAFEENFPSLVILCLGGNDILRKRPFEKIKENLSIIIKKIQAHGAQVLLIGVPTVGLSLSAPALYAELGEELHIPVDVIIMPELLKNPNYKSDYIHFNTAGYEILAQRIAKLLKEYGAVQ